MSTVPSKASKKRRFNVSPEARTSEILCKPTEEQNQRLTRGLSPIYQRGEKRSLFLAADQWNDAFFVSVNPFHAMHVRETMPKEVIGYDDCFFHSKTGTYKLVLVGEAKFCSPRQAQQGRARRLQNAKGVTEHPDF